eukprot:280069_1
MLQLFPKLSKMMLTELSVYDMISKAEEYVSMMLQFVQSNDKQYNRLLETVTISSQLRIDDKQNSILKNLPFKYSPTFIKYQWSFQYQFQIDHKHQLLFNNTGIVITDKIDRL